MEELKKDIEKDIEKYIIYLKKINISKGKKNYMMGMIDSARRVIYNIELNYSVLTYEEIHEQNAKKYREKL